MAQARTMAWPSIVGAMVAGAVVTGVLGWRVNLEGVSAQIKSKRSALKKLVLSGNIPPNQDVADYFTSRQTAFEQRYQWSVKAVDAAPMTETAKADPQLYFQEQIHEVQRTLERLAAARQIPVPEQVGFPKEIPPSDTVPRLLAQLSLIKEAAELIVDQGVVVLRSLKIEDPESVAESEGEGPLLTRLPVRVRLTASLPQLIKLLGALERAQPFIDLRAIRIQPSSSGAAKIDKDKAEKSNKADAKQEVPPAQAAQALPDHLDVDLVLARYLVVASPVSDSAPAEEPSGGTSKKTSSAKKGKSSESKTASKVTGAKGRSKKARDAEAEAP